MTAYPLRNATVADRPALEALIAASARGLSVGYYRPEQVEGALRGAFGVDTQLIEDGTYFVVEAQGALVGCGGWSYRRMLFGGDARAERDATLLVPGVDPAKIRAFFVDPAHARAGIGTRLLERCEREARARGFTLGRAHEHAALYAARGYEPGEPVLYPVGPGVGIEFVPMGGRRSSTGP